MLKLCVLVGLALLFQIVEISFLTTTIKKILHFWTHMGLVKLVTFTGASASGKSTVAKELIDNHHFGIVTSSITRPPREDALQGECEHLTQGQFETLVGESAFAWHLEFAGNRYGTRRDYLLHALESPGSPHLMLLVPSAVDTLYQFLASEGYVPQEVVLPFCFATPAPEMITDRMQRRGDSPKDITRRIQDVARFEEELAASRVDYISISGLGDVNVPVSHVLSYFR